MNNVILTGRMCADPEVAYATTGTAVCKFTLAVDRPNKEESADFIRITVFGKQAEAVDRNLKKGDKCAVQGRIQTGSYKGKDGRTVYTTDVVADRVEFLNSRERPSERPERPTYNEEVYPPF